MCKEFMNIGWLGIVKGTQDRLSMFTKYNRYLIDKFSL